MSLRNQRCVQTDGYRLLNSAVDVAHIDYIICDDVTIFTFCQMKIKTNADIVQVHVFFLQMDRWIFSQSNPPDEIIHFTVQDTRLYDGKRINSFVQSPLKPPLVRKPVRHFS